MSEPNPFTYTKSPATAREFQGNANYATYERMRAQDELNAYDRDKIKAPHDIISAVHTWKWVEKEAIHSARLARQRESV